MADINEAPARRRDICSSGGRAVPCVCDIRDYEQIRAVVKQCMDDRAMWIS